MNQINQPMQDQGHAGQGNQGQGNPSQGRHQRVNLDQPQRNNPEAMPKNLRYDSKDHWPEFKHKFLRYMVFKGWQMTKRETSYIGV
jgi:hypothetical protein